MDVKASLAGFKPNFEVAAPAAEEQQMRYMDAKGRLGRWAPIVRVSWANYACFWLDPVCGHERTDTHKCTHTHARTPAGTLEHRALV